MAAKKKTTQTQTRKAAPPRRSGGGSRGNAARGARKSNVTRINKNNNPLSNEIFCIAAVTCSVLALISLFSRSSSEENTVSAMGAAGNLIRQILLGLFGFGAYLLPISLIAAGVYMLFNKTTILRPAKIYGSLVLFFTLLSLIHIISFDPAIRFNDYADYILTNYRSGSLKNGGFFGALFGNVFYQLLGKTGSFIFLLALSLILFVVVTGRSFFGDMAGLFIWVKDTLSGDEEDEYADYEEDEGEEDEPPQAKGQMKKLTRVSTRPEAPPAAAAKSKTRPKLYTIDNEKEEDKKDEGKILLFSEEMKKGAKKDKKTELKSPENPEDRIAHPVVTEIKVTGLYDEDEEIAEAEPMPAPMFMDEADEEGLEDRSMHEIYINTAPVLPLDIPEPPVITTAPLPAPRVSNTPIAPSIPSLPVVTSGEPSEYVFPPIDFLNQSPNQSSAGSKAQILENSRKLEDTLKSFGVEARVIEVSKGPTVTRYELSPGAGVKVSRISGLADDLALNLAAVGIRIEAPIPGKSAVGIEVPNKEVQPVFLREVLEDDSFKSFPSKLAFALGKDIAGNPVVTDIAKMPHLLIAGATGSGKSVCINTLITSIIYKAKPEEVKLLMVDPKVVELSVYNGIPHLLIPVVTDPKKAAGALNWAVKEMLIRYELFAQTSVRDLKGYNAHKAEAGDSDFLPQIVIIIDELADLMMAVPGEVEDAICRLAQMARAAGLHLIIATQRPSVDVITGLIKANVPSRMAFSVSSGTDSRTILDMVGAEKLLGKGDMLFSPVGLGKPMRIQGAFISDKEVENIVSFVKRGAEQQYDQDMIDNITSSGTPGNMEGEVDEFFEDAVTFIIGKEKASASMLQRQFRIGYNRASRLIEDLEARGIVGPEDGSKPRKVLMTYHQWRAYKEGQEGS